MIFFSVSLPPSRFSTYLTPSSYFSRPPWPLLSSLLPAPPLSYPSAPTLRPLKIDGAAVHKFVSFADRLTSRHLRTVRLDCVIHSSHPSPLLPSPPHPRFLSPHHSLYSELFVLAIVTENEKRRTAGWHSLYSTLSARGLFVRSLALSGQWSTIIYCLLFLMVLLVGAYDLCLADRLLLLLP